MEFNIGDRVEVKKLSPYYSECKSKIYKIIKFDIGYTFDVFLESEVSNEKIWLRSENIKPIKPKVRRL